MGIRARWQFLWESQWRKTTGVAVVVTGVPLIMLGFYDLAVDQLAGEPGNWPRAVDILGTYPWYWWVIGALFVACVFLFEGGYRTTRSRDKKLEELTEQMSLADQRYETDAARLKPMIQTFDPDLQTVNGQPVIGTLRYRFKNVGADMAYDVQWKADFYATPESLITTLVSDWKIDIPPGEDRYQSFMPRYPEWGRVLALLQANTPSIHYILTVHYLHEPRDTQWFQSVHRGKAEFMTIGTPPQVVGWVWIMDGGYSLDRPTEEPPSLPATQSETDNNGQ